jgi:uncharacterized SAM-binding protein YcdF (DUF218 family)
MTNRNYGLARQAALLTLSAWVIGLFWFVSALPMPALEIEGTTDGIVVLTGGAARIDAGLDLLAGRQKGRLLISGVDPRIDRATLRDTLSKDHESFDCCVDLGHTATDTWSNAREIAGWTEANAYRSLTVVTANYHMPRSLLEIQRATPRTRLVAFPVVSSNVPIEGWWRRPRTAALIASEYSKFLLAFAVSPLSGSD